MLTNFKAFKYLMKHDFRVYDITSLPNPYLSVSRRELSPWRVKSSGVIQSKIIEVLCRRERVKEEIRLKVVEILC